MPAAGSPNVLPRLEAWLARTPDEAVPLLFDDGCEGDGCAPVLTAEGRAYVVRVLAAHFACRCRRGHG